MQSEDNQRVIIKTCRKPRVSATQTRKRLSSPVVSRSAVLARPVTDKSLLKRKREIVINRPMQPDVAFRSVNMRPVEKINRTSLDSSRFVDVEMHNHSEALPKVLDASETSKRSSQEMKNEEIRKAIALVTKKSKKQKKKFKSGVHFGFKRILLATACATIVVFAIVYFVNLNAPNISLKVAAMQSGIEASYPAYIPRDFDLSDITSESGKVTLNFKNVLSGDAFALTEEKSSWDSNALLNNYVQVEYGDNYTVIREQGLTLYVSGSNVTWVNGGVVYKLKTTSGSLTKKQLKNIAVSL